VIIVEYVLILDFFTETRVAGRTTDFVNTVLDKVKGGIPDGGLSTMFK
jgi:hypothetical protein